MKNLIQNNWAAKIASLVLASVLWFLIKKNVKTPASVRGPRTGATSRRHAPTDSTHGHSQTH